MKKGFEQQAAEAQKEMANWSDEKRRTVQLQGRYHVEDSAPKSQPVKQSDIKPKSK